jgi:hypothetical protein
VIIHHVSEVFAASMIELQLRKEKMRHPPVYQLQIDTPIMQNLNIAMQLLRRHDKHKLHNSQSEDMIFFLTFVSIK